MAPSRRLPVLLAACLLAAACAQAMMTTKQRAVQMAAAAVQGTSSATATASSAAAAASPTVASSTPEQATQGSIAAFDTIGALMDKRAAAAATMALAWKTATLLKLLSGVHHRSPSPAPPGVCQPTQNCNTDDCVCGDDAPSCQPSGACAAVRAIPTLAFTLQLSGYSVATFSPSLQLLYIDDIRRSIALASGFPPEMVAVRIMSIRDAGLGRRRLQDGSTDPDTIAVETEGSIDDPQGSQAALAGLSAYKQDVLLVPAELTGSLSNILGSDTSVALQDVGQPTLQDTPVQNTCTSANDCRTRSCECPSSAPNCLETDIVAAGETTATAGKCRLLCRVGALVGACNDACLCPSTAPFCFQGQCVVPTVPGPATIASYFVDGSLNLVVLVNPPSNTGTHPLESYTVKGLPVGGSAPELSQTGLGEETSDGQRKFVWALGSYWAQQEYTFEAFATNSAGDGPSSSSSGSISTAAYPPAVTSATITSIGPYDQGQALPYGHSYWTVLTQGGVASASLVSLASQITPAGTSPSVSDQITSSPPNGITGALRLDTPSGPDYLYVATSFQQPPAWTQNQPGLFRGMLWKDFVADDSMRISFWWYRPSGILDSGGNAASGGVILRLRAFSDSAAPGGLFADFNYELYRHYGGGSNMEAKSNAWNQEITWATLGSDATPLNLWYSDSNPSYITVPSANCQHGPGQSIGPTTPEGPAAVGCEAGAGTNWIQLQLPVDNVPATVTDSNGATKTRPLRSQARSLRTYTAILRDSGNSTYTDWYNTAYIANVQLGLANPPNNYGYVGNLKIEAGGFAWEWKFEPPTDV